MEWWRRILVRLGLRREKEGGLPGHVDQWIRELVDAGIDPQAAREEALRGFGIEDPAGPGASIRGCRCSAGSLTSP
jgi:hypothetical protein